MNKTYLHTLLKSSIFSLSLFCLSHTALAMETMEEGAIGTFTPSMHRSVCVHPDKLQSSLETTRSLARDVDIGTVVRMDPSRDLDVQGLLRTRANADQAFTFTRDIRAESLLFTSRLLQAPAVDFSSIFPVLDLSAFTAPLTTAQSFDLTSVTSSLNASKGPPPLEISFVPFNIHDFLDHTGAGTSLTLTWEEETPGCFSRLWARLKNLVSSKEKPD